MNKFTFNFLVILLCGLTIPNQIFAQVPDWTRVLQVNTIGYPTVNVVTTDADYAYMAGKISGPITFEGINYTSVGLSDLLIAKISNAGATEWVKQFDAQAGGSIVPNAIKVDAGGNVFIEASFSGTVTIGGNTISSSNLYNAFYAKFDNAGIGLWATPFLSTGFEASKIAIDGNGNSFVISKTANLLKFSSSGTLLWKQDYPSRTLQTIAVDGSNLYVGGTLQGGTTNFGTIALTSLGGYNTGFLIKADLNGVYTNSLIVEGSTSTDGSSVSDMVMDNNGNLIIAGSYTKDLILGNITITSTTNYAHFTYIAKCDANFNFTWAKSSSEIPSVQNARQMGAYRIFLDNSNNIYEYGIINSSFTFGNINLNLTTENQFLIKFDSGGNAINGYALENTSFDRTFVSKTGKVLAGGHSSYTGSANYGNFYFTQFNNVMNQDWQKNSSNSQAGFATIRNVKHDASGNTYIQSRIIGYCNYFGTIINSNIPLTVISRHDIAGNMLWMNQIADINPDLYGQTFTLDKNRNILTLGLFHTSLTIGSTTLTSTNTGNEGYVAKYSPNGVLLWAKTLSLNADIAGITLASDNAGNILVTGVLAPANFLIKFDPQGNKLWENNFPMESYYTSLVSTDANNNIYLTSEIHLDNGTAGSTTIGNITLTQTPEDGSTVLIKFDPDGNAQWAKTYGGVTGATWSNGWPCDIKTDAIGNSFIWGWIPDNAKFGSTTLTNPFATHQNYSYFLAKINTSGDVVWANAVYEKKYSFNYGDLLDLDENGNAYIGGHFKDNISIEGTEYFPEGTNDFFAAKYSSAGAFQWIKTIPANGTIINSLSINKDNVLSIGGNIGKNSTLGGINIINSSGSNSMVATLGPLPLSVSEINNNSISIYPNPASNILFIDGLKHNSTASIFDINGKILINKQIINNQIDISSLPNGFYIIKITEEGETGTLKFVKQ